jgi:capsular polysaccharide transport system permease protein
MSVVYPSSVNGRVLGRRGFGAALAVNLRVIGALMMREGTTKFGHENLGFFWVIGGPLILTGGVMLMWTITGQTHGHGIGIVPFALSSYTMITLWRHLTQGAVQSIRRNAGLLYHRNVRLLDILLARSALEIVGILAAFFVAFVPLALLGIVDPLRDPLVLMGGYLLHGWFSFSVGLIIAGLSEFFEPVEHLVPPFLYITLPFTGTFYMVSWLPDRYREAVLWSPLVNTQEMLRSGMFPAQMVTYWYPWYVVLWCVALTAIGLPLVQLAQKHVTVE